jgi:hypothetical protein
MHKPLPVSGFQRPIIRSYQNMWSCELYINPSNATLNQFKIFPMLVRGYYFLCHLSYVTVVTVQLSFESLSLVTFTNIALLLFSLAVSWFPYWYGSSLCGVIVDSAVTERRADILWVTRVDVSCIRVGNEILNNNNSDSLRDYTAVLTFNIRNNGFITHNLPTRIF